MKLILRHTFVAMDEKMSDIEFDGCDTNLI
jgi:hypothetical protein